MFNSKTITNQDFYLIHIISNWLQDAPSRFDLKPGISDPAKFQKGSLKLIQYLSKVSYQWCVENDFFTNLPVFVTCVWLFCSTCVHAWCVWLPVATEVRRICWNLWNQSYRLLGTIVLILGEREKKSSLQDQPVLNHQAIAWVSKCLNIISTYFVSSILEFMWHTMLHELLDRTKYMLH